MYAREQDGRRIELDVAVGEAPVWITGGAGKINLTPAEFFWLVVVAGPAALAELAAQEGAGE